MQISAMGLKFSYSGGTNGALVQISSTNGRYLSFSRDSQSRITQATGKLGRTLSYVYDSSGRLSTVTLPHIMSYSDRFGLSRLPAGLRSKSGT